MQKTMYQLSYLLQLQGLWLLEFFPVLFQFRIHGLNSEPNNKDNLLWQESNNSNTYTVNAKQIYSSHGNIIDQTIIESGINGTKV